MRQPPTALRSKRLAAEPVKHSPLGKVKSAGVRDNRVPLVLRTSRHVTQDNWCNSAPWKGAGLQRVKLPRGKGEQTAQSAAIAC